MEIKTRFYQGLNQNPNKDEILFLKRRIKNNLKHINEWGI